MASKEASAGHPLTKDEFARLMIDSIRKGGEKASVLYDAQGFTLAAKHDGKPHIMNLINCYNECCSAPADQQANIVRRFTRAWFAYKKELPKDFADAQTDVLPSVRNRTYFEIGKMHLEVKGLGQSNWPYQLLAEHLGVGLVYDWPDSISVLHQGTLTDWGVTFEDALKVAKKNLASISQQRFDNPAPGVWASPWRDNYDLARVILYDVIRQHPVKGDPVAILPNRDTLLITGSEDEAGLATLATLAEKAIDHPRPCSTLPIRLEAEAWVPFVPPVGHPQHQAFQVLAMQSVFRDYGEQAEALVALYKKKDEDIFVAKYSAVELNDTGEVMTYCVWSKGVDTVLPRTDRIFLFRPKGESGDIVAQPRWERVMEVCGDLLVPLDLYPVRYRVRGTFPTKEQLKVLAADGL